MKKIPLTQGKFAIVDDEDFERLSQWNWYYKSDRNHRGYVVRQKRISTSKQQTIYMHRQIINTPEDLHTDHINGDGLDNRISNLRICTRSENLMNQRSTTGASKFKGVVWHKTNKKWQAQIKHSGRTIYLGTFTSEIHAAEAYNLAAPIYQGEFVRLNKL